MKRETIVWTVIFIASGLFLLYRGMSAPHGLGRAYVKAVRINKNSATDLRTAFVDAKPTEQGAKLSVSRTVGLWISAFLTLAILSFLYRDNVFYKVAESIMVGFSAAWAMVGAGF